MDKPSVDFQSSLYRPLDSTRCQFRLVRTCTELSLTLGVFDMQSAPPYKALSYEWGSSEPESARKHSAVVDGVRFDVRPGLHAFLHQLAAHGDDDWYFIDAICIDQREKSREERESQIPLMGNIYRRAVKVVVWLGLPNPIYEGLGRNLDPVALRKYYSIFDIALQAYHSTDPHGTLRDHFKETAKTELFLFNLYDVVRTICVSTYWTRLWIVQELLLARDVEIWYKCVRLRWESVFLIVEHYLQNFHYYCTSLEFLEAWWKVEAIPDATFSYLRRYIKLLPAAVKEPQNLRRMRENSLVLNQDFFTQREDEKDILACAHLAHGLLWRRLQLMESDALTLSFHEAMIAFCYQRRTVPHDSIYGLLGLTGIRVAVSYSITELDLYCRILIAALPQQARPAEWRRENVEIAVKLITALYTALCAHEKLSDVSVLAAMTLEELGWPPWWQNLRYVMHALLIRFVAERFGWTRVLWRPRTRMVAFPLVLIIACIFWLLVKIFEWIMAAYTVVILGLNLRTMSGDKSLAEWREAIKDMQREAALSQAGLSSDTANTERSN